MAKKKHDTSNIDNLLASVTPDMLGDGFADVLADNSIRVERFLLDMIRPDPVQPRRVLPEQIHRKFHDSRLTPTQALRELVQIAQVSARQNGRPFSNVLELLPDADSENEETVKQSPEEETLCDLVNLAVTIRDDGQVNPLTVVDMTEGVTRLYRIETGERRYWATWILRDFIPGYEHDGMIDCIIVPSEKSSIFRQAKENTARKGLSAIAMARQAALLLLTVHGYEIPVHAVDNDFYGQALELDLRGKREYTETILSAMGGIDKRRFSQYKLLLQLSDEALETADRHNLDEFRLRPVLQLPLESQQEMIQHIIQFNLSGRQIQQICEKGYEDDKQDAKEVKTHVTGFIKSMKKISDKDEEVFLQNLIQVEQSVEMAQARIETMIAFLMRSKKRLNNQ